MDILKRLELDFIFQAGFLSPKSFYIVDFYVKSPYRLVIEINDFSHKYRKKRLRDKRKINYLKKCGYKVIIFTNDAVLNQGLQVQRQIKACLESIESTKLKSK